jgi:hypothetical protein
MHRIQTELPGWIQKTGRQTEAMPLLKKAHALAREKKWQEADNRADELLNLMKKDRPKGGKSDAPPLQVRLPAKIQQIQKELPPWVGADAAKAKKATALMQQLDRHIKARNLEEAEKIADSILKMIGVNSPR